MLSVHDKVLSNPPSHTIKEIPKTTYLGLDFYPEQDQELLGKVIELDYRIPDFYDSEHEDSPDDHEETYYKTGKFMVLRADLAEPYALIAISPDYNYMIVSSNKVIEGTPIYANTVTFYPIQDPEYIGTEVEDYFYTGDYFTDFRANFNTGYVIAWSACEPTIGVIVEEIAGKVRFILDHEVLAKPVNKTEISTDIDIIEFRKSKIEGKIIYGID